MKIALLTADVGNPMPNVGDFFITHPLEQRWGNSHRLFRIPLHQHPDRSCLGELRSMDLLVVCGSNIVGINGTVRCAFEPEDFEAIGRPVLPVGLGSQAERGLVPRLDERGQALLRHWYRTTGAISVRDKLTQNALENYLGKGTSVLTGCPSLLVRQAPFAEALPRMVFCPGPYHYVPYGGSHDYFQLTRELYQSLAASAPTLYLAQQPSDLLFGGAKPGPTTLHAPSAPECHLKALVSSSGILSFRIHPLIVASVYDRPGLLIALDARTESLAETLGLPYLRYEPSLTAERVLAVFQKTLADYPWEKVRRVRKQLTTSLEKHLDRHVPQAREKKHVSKAKAPALSVACIADENYFPGLLGLIENLSEIHRGPLSMHLLQLGEKQDDWLRALFPDIDFQFYDLGDLWHPAAKRVIETRPRHIVAYSSKACLLSQALQRAKGPILFSDVDIFYYRSPERLTRSSGKVMLFPHWNDELKNNLLHGVFNSGLMVIKPGAESFLAWWASLCLEACENSGEEGKYFEQAYLDMAPAAFPEVEIYRRGDENVAEWNLRSLGIGIETHAPWRPAPEIGSFHAHARDELKLFERKFAWDQLSVWFSGWPWEKWPSPFFENMLLQQKSHWSAVKRVVYVKEALASRFSLNLPPIPPRLAEFCVSGPGRRPLALSSFCYSRLRDWKNRLHPKTKKIPLSEWVILQRAVLEKLGTGSPSLLDLNRQVQKLASRQGKSPSKPKKRRPHRGRKLFNQREVGL